MRIRTAFIFFLIINLFLSVSCKGEGTKEILEQSDTLPVIDGMIGESEYRVTIETEKIMLHLSRNSEVLVFGLTGKTAGWIAIGFGSMGMDQSHIVMGYSTGDTMVTGEHYGTGHKHPDTDNRILVEAVLKEKDGNTIFEGSVKVNEVIQAGQTDIPVIIAFGATDDFTSRHIFRTSLVIRLSEK